jgi:3-hydroxyacyl-[acyl-carrier protein] dehydratase/trans-2-decenoyl-[acyl-carrier protein] isomerase
VPGSLGPEAPWQLTGIYLGWLGAAGKGRALDVGAVKLSGVVTPRIARIEHVIDIKRVLLRRLKLAIADGVLKADREIVCAATDATVGLSEFGAPNEPTRQPGISC